MPHVPFRRLVAPDPHNGIRGDKVFAGTFNDIYEALEDTPTMDDLSGAVGGFNAANYPNLQAALNAAAGHTLTVPPGAYNTAGGSLVVPAGTTVDMHPNAVIEQTRSNTDPLPVFDILDADDVTIIGGQIEWNGSRDRVAWGSSRGGNKHELLAGVWTNSQRTKVIGTRIFGFSPGVAVSGYNGSSKAAGHTGDTLIQDVVVDTCAFGILADGTRNLTIRNVSGNWETLTDIGAGVEPGHLLYLSNAADSYAPNIEGMYASGGSDSFAYQFKGCIGGSARGLHAGVVPLLINLIDNTGLTVEDISAEETTDSSGYAVDFNTDVTDTIVRAVYLGEVPGLSVAAVRGTRNLLEKIRATTSTGSYNNSLAHADIAAGTGNTIRDLAIHEIGAQAAVAASITGGSGHLLESIQGDDLAYVVRVTSSGAGVARFDPALSTTVETYKVYYDATINAASKLVIPATRRSVSVGTTSAVVPNPSTSTVTAITETAAVTVTIDPPIDGTSTPNAEHTFEIIRSSASAPTTSWNSTWWKLATAWSEPANGATKSITFVFNGSAWIEKARA